LFFLFCFIFSVSAATQQYRPGESDSEYSAAAELLFVTTGAAHLGNRNLGRRRLVRSLGCIGRVDTATAGVGQRLDGRNGRVVWPERAIA
jgi:hypothetical protein